MKRDMLGLQALLRWSMVPYSGFFATVIMYLSCLCRRVKKGPALYVFFTSGNDDVCTF